MEVPDYSTYIKYLEEYKKGIHNSHPPYPYIDKFKIKGQEDEEYCEAEQIVSELLKLELCFVNYRKFWCDSNKRIEDYTIVVFLICNDLFAWGCADCESIGSEKDLISIWKYHCDDSKYGTLKWCCKKRNMQPQGPYIDLMKNDGCWTDELESLRKNGE